MIKRMTQLQWAKRALERLGTPKDIAWTGWMHKPPTAACIERGYAAALHAFELGLPIEGLGASARVSENAKPFIPYGDTVPGNVIHGDVPAAVCLDLGQHWTAKHTALWIWFEANGCDTAMAFAAGYRQQGHVWKKPFTEALWPEIAVWLRGEAAP